MFDFKITPDGGEPYEVTATTRDVVAWEKTAKGASIMDLLANYRMVDLYKLAHIASRRQGMFAGTLSEFEGTCELDFKETRAPDPTQPAP